MIKLHKKAKYLLEVLPKFFIGQGRTCPSCGCTSSTLVQRKYWVTALRRCSRCKLMFRVPTTSREENERFYQREYSQGFTTSLPSAEELERLKRSHFRGNEKDYSKYLRVLTALGSKPGDAVLDFGCSWGYGSWQLRQAGYRITAYEISVPRCTYARQELGIDAHFRLDELGGPFDIFFSSHVFEHVPSVSQCIQFAMQSVKPGGWLVVFTPNGSEPFRRVDFQAWNQLWGQVHPNYLDDVFYKNTFRDYPFLLSSGDVDEQKIREWALGLNGDQVTLDLAGIELLLIVKMRS
ncbi:MAG: methyltransferase domain-containing protein [Anaerolineae bacterium]|nr:methyltransferase domain-containing protein [Anaerolineae bacterium]